MKIESVDLPTVNLKATTVELEKSVVVTKKPLPLSQSNEKKKVASNIDNKNVEKSKPAPWENKKCRHYWFTSGSLAQQYIQYACEVSNYDVDFILTLQHENWSWDTQKQSNVVQKGVREPSYGLCQMHYRFHKKDVYDNLPYNRIRESKYLSDWKYQIDTCWRKYKGGTRFYGYDYRYKGNKWLILIGNTRY